METKICCKCKLSKEISYFSKDKYSKDGLTYSCKLCKKKQDREYNKKPKSIELVEHKKRSSAKWREENPEKVKALRVKRYEEHKEKILSNNKIYRDKNVIREKERIRKYYYDNKQKALERSKKHYYIKIKNDPLYKLKVNTRSRVTKFLKQQGYSKKNKTFFIVGCSPEFLKEYIEKKFTEGMSWELMGKYIHIDHIMPLSSAKNEDDIYKLCHYTNLQPLWAIDNLKKGSKPPF